MERFSPFLENRGLHTINRLGTQNLCTPMAWFRAQSKVKPVSPTYGDIPACRSAFICSPVAECQPCANQATRDELRYCGASLEWMKPRTANTSPMPFMTVETAGSPTPGSGMPLQESRYPVSSETDWSFLHQTFFDYRWPQNAQEGGVDGHR